MLSKPSRSRFAVGVVLAIVTAIVGGLVWGFGQQLSLARKMRAEEIRLEQAVATKQARHDDLAARAEYVKSDEYVEHWARRDAVMAKSGEVAVVVVEDQDEDSTPEAQPAQAVESEERSFWVDLWELVFGPTEREHP